MSNTNTGHPKGLYILFMTEMWERFSYYGMRAIFALYMVNALLMDKGSASNIYGSYTGLVYLTPLIGGYISDKYWGNRRSIVVGGIVMAIGQFMMFFSGMFYSNHALALPFFWVGLTLLIVGNGFFKPNISTMVGQLYPAGDGRVDSAFTIFYMGINLGALFSPLVCGTLGEHYDASGASIPGDFKWGFFAAGVGMIISTITFLMFKNKYIVTHDGQPIGMPKSSNQPPSGEQDIVIGEQDIIKKEDNAIPKFTSNSVAFWGIIWVALFAAFKYLPFLGFDWIGAGIPATAVAIAGLIITDKTNTNVEKQRIWVIFILAFFVIFFWSAFEQAGASLTFFAQEQTDRHIFGWEMPASYFQSINPIGIVVIAPLFSMMWVALGKKKLEPSSPMKMAFGLLMLCIGYIVIAFGVKDAGAVKVGMFWLVTMYLLHTLGELSLSPIGLFMVSKLAPLRFSALLMGMWFMANALANKLAGGLSGLYPPGPGEIKDATKAGIDLQSMLNGTAHPTADQITKLKDLGIPYHYPSLLGIQIHNLYEFFMIFVIMAGVASFLLFVLYRRLEKMMHGVK